MTYSENTYENTRRIVYDEGATFVPLCKRCGRFVKADKTIRLQGGTLADEPNATCSRCGRVQMPFEGFI